MATHTPESPPLLAQVAVAELAPHLSTGGHDGSAPRREVRRRAGLRRAAKRLVSVLFLTLGIVSVVALLRGVPAAASDGWGSDDAIPLVMLGLISAVVVSQALGLLRTMPGVGRIWRRAALARQGRAEPSRQRPLLAQAEARSLLPGMGPSAQHRGEGGLRSAATTAGWVALTVSIMAAAILGTGLVARSALRSIEARGWGPGSLLGLGVAGLVGYGVTIMSIGLIRSWFERRRRRLRRMLMRLSRYLIRGFDRSTTVLPRLPVGLDGAVGFLGRGVLATGGAAVAVAASVAIPVMALNGTTTIWDGLASTSPSISIVVDVGNDNGTGVPIVAAGEDQPQDGGAEEVLSDTLSNATANPIAGSTTTTNETTTKTTTTTTSSSRDATGPIVSDISDTPDPIFSAGNKQDTSQITVTTTDKSGVATVTMYYRFSGGTFAIWTTLKPGTVTTTFGPFTKPGIYEYRIMATDTLGNANCKTPDTCPGGTVTVTSTKDTTTTTTSKTTTTTIKTTTTTTVPIDTTGPVVSDISDTPDPIFTAGNKQDTSQITVTTTDKSGVATVTMYYRFSGGTFAIWTTLKPGTVTTTFGPFTKPGIYEYRIMATDTLGNANCKTPDTCPGGTVNVVPS